MAELVDAMALGAIGVTRGGSSPLPPSEMYMQRGCSSGVERHVANVNVVGSNPITRSFFVSVLW